MGNNRQVILKIFKLDNNIYNELASEITNFQIAIAIYVSGFLFSGLAALSFLRNSLVYLEQNIARLRLLKCMAWLKSFAAVLV